MTARKQTDDAARRAESLYRALAKNFPNGAVALFDKDLRYMLFDGQGLAEAGLSKEALEGRTLFDCFPPETHRISEPHYRAALSGKSSVSEVPYGGRIYLVHYVPIHDEHGAVIAGMAMSQNITERKRSEDALRESEERFQFLSRATYDVVWDWDLATDAVWWSENLKTQFGYTTKDIEPTLKWWTNLIHPEDQDRVGADLQAALKRGKQFLSLEYRLRRADGSYANVLDRGYVVHDEHGKPVRMIGAVMDISSRKRAEQTLQDTEARLRLALQGSRSGIWDWNLITGRIIWSREHEELWGMLPGTFKGTYEEFDARLHPDDRAGLNRAVEQALAEHRAYGHEFRVVWPDGSVHWVAGQGEPLFDDTGKPVRMIGTVVDITGRKHAEQSLRESHERLQRALEASQTGTWRVDLRTGLDTRDASLNRMLGLVAEPSTQPVDDWFTYVHPDDASPMRSAWEQALVSGLYDTEHRLVRRDGTVLWVYDRGVVVRDDAGQPLYVIGAAMDITERKRMEDRLQHNEERFRQLAETITEVFWMTNPDKNEVLYISPGYERIWGRPRESIYERPTTWLEAIHPDDRDRVLQSAMTKQVLGTYDEEYRIMRPDGSMRWIWDRAFPIQDASGRVYRITGIAEDITERKQAEQKVARLNRVYAMLSGINSVIVRVHDWRELFDEACRLAVTSGEFRAAWIGMLDRKAARVVPVAFHNMDEELLDRLKTVTQQDKGEGRGIVWHAVQTKCAVVSNDIERDRQVILMREALLAHGIRALAVLPLLVAGGVAGMLVLYGGETGLFDEAEIDLLNQVAGDIAFGLDHIQKEERIAYLAYYDSLTGLANRTLFHERLTQFINTAQRERHKLALCVVDIDHFKDVNDALGRQVGDMLLTQFAQRLTCSVDDAGQTARLSADHFVVVLPDIEGERAVLREVEELMTQCTAQPFQLSATELRIAIKIGVALYPNHGADADALFHNAEAALKKAKAGGERYLFYAQEMTEHIGEKLELESKLRRAHENEEFVLYYQPKVDARTRRITGVEALIRWFDPQSGIVLPGKFVPLLEGTGMILDVGTWAIRRAIQDRAYWTAKGVAAPRVAVNVSAVQLRQHNFVDVVRDAVTQAALPVAIDLEITESLIMSDVEANIDKLREISDLGVNIVIDDFGTGYSSLGYLARLPARTMKIDLSFTARMLEDPGTMTLVTTMISLAHSLGLRVVAEGVETEAQAEALLGLHCDELQGYLLGPPIPREQVAEMLLQQASQAAPDERHRKS